MCPDGGPDRRQNLIIRSVAHCQLSLIISCIFVMTFLRKLATDKQTNKQTNNEQTNNDDYIYSLREVKMIKFGLKSLKSFKRSITLQRVNPGLSIYRSNLRNDLNRTYSATVSYICVRCRLADVQ